MAPEEEKPEAADSDFEAQASRPSRALWNEFWVFLVREKKWWLVPILLALLLLGLLALAAGSGLGPFIYPLV